MVFVVIIRFAVGVEEELSLQQETIWQKNPFVCMFLLKLFTSIEYKRSFI